MVSITPVANEPDADGWIQVKGDDVQVKVCRNFVLILFASFRCFALFLEHHRIGGALGTLGQSYGFFCAFV